jgi:CRISPR-associated endonuclease/helicase Cas3
LDKKGIQKVREELNYPRVAEKYRLIEEDTVSVVVPYGDAEERIEAWQESPSRQTWQRLQPYMVSLFRREAQRLEREGWLEAVSEGLYSWRGLYDSRKGIVEAVYDPSDLNI